MHSRFGFIGSWIHNSHATMYIDNYSVDRKEGGEDNRRHLVSNKEFVDEDQREFQSTIRGEIYSVQH